MTNTILPFTVNQDFYKPVVFTVTEWRWAQGDGEHITPETFLYTNQENDSQLKIGSPLTVKCPMIVCHGNTFMKSFDPSSP